MKSDNGLFLEILQIYNFVFLNSENIKQLYEYTIASCLGEFWQIVKYLKIASDGCWIKFWNKHKLMEK